MTQESMIQEIEKILNENNLYIYRGHHNEDILLLHLWYKLVENNELEKTWNLPIAPTLSEFFDEFSRPTTFVYGPNDDIGIWFAAWFTPLFAGRSTLMGFWVEKSKRQTKEGVKLTYLVYRLALKVWPHVFGVTRGELIGIHEKIGYRVLAKLGEDSFLVLLTKDNFKMLEV